MGMGGFYIYSWVGFDIFYMGDEFMGYVKVLVEFVKVKSFFVCLYDEDWWLSGVVGGFVVVNNLEYKVMYFFLIKWEYCLFELLL